MIGRNTPKCDPGSIRANCPLVRDGGFTLIELLLAITLLGLIMTMAYGGLRAGTRTSDAGIARIEKTNQLRVTHQFLRRQIRLILPLAMEIDDDDQQVLFEGDGEQMRFVAPMPGYLGVGGPHVQILTFEKSAGDTQLLFDHYLLNRFEDAEDDEREPIVLLDGIDEAEFEYVALDDQGELDDWRSDWDSPGVIPVKVRIAIRFAERSRIPFPDLVAVPVIDSAAARQSVRPSIFSRQKQK